MAKLPSWPVLWGQYYDYVNYSSETVKQEIGGRVTSEKIKNTCAVRMSYAMNYIGIKVPPSFPGMVTVAGGDGLRYAVRSLEMREWLRHELGMPDFYVKKKANEPFDKSTIPPMQGVIAFKIKFTDASGHLDVWTHGRFSADHIATKDYFNAATRISIWKCA